jgi:hypothetical protein
MVQRIHNSLELKAIREWRLESQFGQLRVRREDNSILRYEIGTSELGRYYGGNQVVEYDGGNLDGRSYTC